MKKTADTKRFNQLSMREQARYREAAQAMVRFAQDCAVPIVFAPPPRNEGEINTATGSVLKLDCGCFVVTARHVLDGYEKRIRSGEKLNWQVGYLPPFDPLPRVAWRGPDDTLLLRISSDEAAAIGSTILSPSTGWPPRSPQEGEPVLVAGYPKNLRKRMPSDTIGFDPVSAMFRVTTAGEGYFVCQIERESLISFDAGPLPDPSMDMGGLSGGPALLVEKLVYPLVGVVSEYHQGFDLLRIATLAGAKGADTSPNLIASTKKFSAAKKASL